MVNGDERMRVAFTESIKVALAEMESFAPVRERRGDTATSEAFRLAGNFVGAIFIHDTSRNRDPQLHAYAFLANATADYKRRIGTNCVQCIAEIDYLCKRIHRLYGGWPHGQLHPITTVRLCRGSDEYITMDEEDVYIFNNRSALL